MKRDLESLARGPGAMAAVLALALALLWALVARGVTRFIVPPPDEVGQSFFSSLSAHNYAAAYQDLSSELRQTLTPDDLQEMIARLEQSEGGIQRANGVRSIEQGQSATAEITITLDSGTQRTVTVPFTQVKGLWYISSLVPLEGLLESAQRNKEERDGPISGEPGRPDPAFDATGAAIRY